MRALIHEWMNQGFFSEGLKDLLSTCEMLSKSSFILIGVSLYHESFHCTKICISILPTYYLSLRPLIQYPFDGC